MESFGSQAAEPKLENGAIYRPLRPTTLDKIKNFPLEVQASAVKPGWERRIGDGRQASTAGLLVRPVAVEACRDLVPRAFLLLYQSLDDRLIQLSRNPAGFPDDHFW